MILFIFSLTRVFPFFFLFFSYNPPFFVPKRGKKKKNPFSQLGFPLIYRPPHCSYFYSCYTIGLVSRDIFLTLLVSSPSLSPNSAFCEIFFMFKLFHRYLMRQRLGESSQIEAEIKIFNPLACPGSFPQFLAPPGCYV